MKVNPGDEVKGYSLLLYKNYTGIVIRDYNDGTYLVRDTETNLNIFIQINYNDTIIPLSKLERVLR